METTRRKAERPSGNGRSQVKSIRFDEVDLERLRTLARRWQCSEAAAVRRAIADAIQHAEREDERQAMQEPMRHAADQLLEYYTSDSEALELADFVGDDLNETR